MVRQRDYNFLEDFESSWGPAQAGLWGTLKFLSRHSARPYSNNVVCPLIQLDLEKSWLMWDRHVRQLAATASCATILHQLRKPPRLTGYKTLLEEVQATQTHIKQLAQAEYELRNQCGDMIGPAYYRTYFDVDVAFHYAIQLRHVYDLSPEASDVALVQGIELRGLSQFGRRRSTDDRGLSFEHRPEGTRVIIASTRERRVSRLQASFQILNNDFGWLRNESALNSMTVNPGGVLHSSKEMLVEFPFRIRLPNALLLFQ